MRAFSFILITFFTGCVYGQTEKVLTIPTYINYKNEVDTTPWFKWKQDLVKQINLTDLKTSNESFHFRFWTDIQAIDIWTINYNRFYGEVTNYAQKYDDKLLRKGIYKIGKTYSNQLTLDSSKARQIFNVIDKLSIITIPTDDKISGWRQGLDGEEYLIEISTPKQYDFRTYWTPRIFADTIKEAKQLQTLIDYLYTDLEIQNYYQKLKLPKGSYQRNGIPGIEIKSTNQYIPAATTITGFL